MPIRSPPPPPPPSAPPPPLPPPPPRWPERRPPLRRRPPPRSPAASPGRRTPRALDTRETRARVKRARHGRRVLARARAFRRGVFCCFCCWFLLLAVVVVVAYVFCFSPVISVSIFVHCFYIFRTNAAVTRVC